MKARILNRILRTFALVGCLISAGANFQCKDQKVLKMAEAAKADLEKVWFGKELKFPNVVPIEIRDAKGFEGMTTYDQNGIQIRISSRKNNDTIRHEVMHALTFVYLGARQPRWYAEGIATQVEEFESQRRMGLIMEEAQIIPLNQFLSFTEYPEDKLLLFYAQSYAFTKWLLTLKGKEHFFEYIEKGGSLSRHYGYKNAVEMENAFIDWLESPGDGQCTGPYCPPRVILRPFRPHPLGPPDLPLVPVEPEPIPLEPIEPAPPAPPIGNPGPDKPITRPPVVRPPVVTIPNPVNLELEREKKQLELELEQLKEQLREREKTCCSPESAELADLYNALLNLGE